MGKKKKSYNPFTMWGSYVGLGIPLLFWIYISGACISIIGFGCTSGRSWSIKESLMWWKDTFLGIEYISVVIVTLLAGFLVGWGIHSLIRRLRN